ncbi:MAG: hypothetical protein HRU19_06585 [Pseudobacteriovorax sp.]|nr:hypothetical protein [Pseudobacteriovorax sp.]
MKVQSIILPNNSISIDCSWTLAEVSRFFTSFGVQYLSILKGGEFFGVISRSDFKSYLKDLDETEASLDSRSVKSITTKPLFYCHPEDQVQQIFRSMTRGEYNFLGVKRSKSVIAVIPFATIKTIAQSL